MVKRVGVVDFEVDMAGSRKPRRVCHHVERNDPAELVGFTQEQCEEVNEYLVAWDGRQW